MKMTQCGLEFQRRTADVESSQFSSYDVHIFTAIYHLIMYNQYRQVNRGKMHRNVITCSVSITSVQRHKLSLLMQHLCNIHTDRFDLYELEGRQIVMRFKHLAYF